MRKIEMKKNYIIVMLLLVSVLFHPPVVSHAIDTQLNDKVFKACEMYEKILGRSIKKQEQQLEELIAGNDYDHALSMEYYNEQENPFRNYDYLDLIAVRTLGIYENCKVYSHELTYCYMEYKEKETKEYVPVKMPWYTEVEKNLYQTDGIFYLTEPRNIDTFEKEGDYYRKTGRKKVEPETKIVTYIEPYLRPATPEELIGELGLVYEEVKEEYEKIKEALLKADHDTEISARVNESVWLNRKSQQIKADGEALLVFTETLAGVKGTNRGILLETAAALIGKVPYHWGGKAAKPGYDTSWWSFNEKGEQKGLDCSGFVQWVYWTAGYSKEVYQSLLSTASIRETAVPIAKEELQPGDLGILNTGETVNHTGIYVGNGYFIHCNGTYDTVTMDQYDFLYFYRVEGVDTESLLPYEIFEEPTAKVVLTDEEIYLTAQTVSHEAAGEGLNGWIGVAEVIRNRLISPAFPDTLSEVIYEQEQFEANEDIALEEPTEAIIETVREVMDGNLSIFRNPDVLFFRNPGEEGNADWGKYPFYIRIRNHVFYTYTAEQEKEAGAF